MNTKLWETDLNIAYSYFRESMLTPVRKAYDHIQTNWPNQEHIEAEMRRRAPSFNLPVEKNMFLRNTFFVACEEGSNPITYVVIFGANRCYSDEDKKWALSKAKLIWEEENGTSYPGDDAIYIYAPHEFVPGSAFRAAIPLTDHEKAQIDYIDNNCAKLTLDMLTLWIDGFGWRPGMHKFGGFPEKDHLIDALLCHPDTDCMVDLVEAFLASRYQTRYWPEGADTSQAAT